MNIFDQVHFGYLHSDSFSPISTEEALSKGKLCQFCHKIFHFDFEDHKFELGKDIEGNVDKRAAYVRLNFTPVLFGHRFSRLPSSS